MTKNNPPANSNDILGKVLKPVNPPIPDESCSRCQNESFCRYKDTSRKETECVCKKTTEGENCEIDLCSKCQNGGYCDFKDATNEIQCICSFPFHGEFCEGKS